jgi:DNA modification methylase
MTEESFGIYVKPVSQLTSHEHHLLELAKLNAIAPTETWTAIGTSKQLSYLTHGIYRYFGKFPPKIATKLINDYTNENDIVMDPMCGSGTTGIEAMLHNRNAILNDVNPLSVLLSQVKTTYIDAESINQAIYNLLDNYRPLSVDEYSFEPIGVKNINHWFLSETQNSLRGIKYIIDQEKDIHVQRFLKAIFASIIRRVSKATSQQGRLFLDVETAQTDALPAYIKKAQQAVTGVSQLPHNSSSIDIYNDDAKKLYLSTTVNLVIAHPPYFNSYKYSNINSLEMSWLGYDISSTRKQEIREFFKIGKSENAAIYLSDMFDLINHLYNQIEVGGYLALMIGDTIIKGEYIPITYQLIQSLSHLSLEVTKVILRVPKHTEAAWVTSQRRNSNSIGISLCDYIIVFRRMR